MKYKYRRLLIYHGPKIMMLHMASSPQQKNSGLCLNVQKIGHFIQALTQICKLIKMNGSLGTLREIATEYH